MPAIKPQDKNVKRTFSIPGSLSERLDACAVLLNDSDPEHIVAEALKPALDQIEREYGRETKPVKAGRQAA